MISSRRCVFLWFIVLIASCRNILRFFGGGVDFSAGFLSFSFSFSRKAHEFPWYKLFLPYLIKISGVCTSLRAAFKLKAFPLSSVTSHSEMSIQRFWHSRAKIYDTKFVSGGHRNHAIETKNRIQDNTRHTR